MLQTLRPPVVVLVVLGACSDATLDYPVKPVELPSINDEVTLRGDFCTSSAANLAFPVKVMFIVDGSGSLQFTDQNRQRVVAVEQAVNALLGTENTWFKVIVFNATVSAVPSGPGFTRSHLDLISALDGLAEADTVTDYQGALGVAYAELLRDISDTKDPGELARTKYILIFISDGMPDPQCTVGLNNDFDRIFISPTNPTGIDLLCESQDYLNCLFEVSAAVAPPGARCGFGAGAPCDAACAPLDLDGDGAAESNVCNFNGTPCYRVKDPQTLFGGLNTTELMAGGDYNQPYQILQEVQDIMDLQDRFGIGAIQVHAGLVLDPLADPAIIAIFGDATQAVPLMQQVAKIGGGQYMEFYGGDSIDFLQLNFDSLRENRMVSRFFVDNVAARLTRNGLARDTDFDGLSDDEEIDLGTNPFAADTDADGYRDSIEWNERAFGLDPQDPCLPAIVDVRDPPPPAPCDPKAPLNCDFDPAVDRLGNPIRRYVDRDADGLHDCEERWLGTDFQRADTDRDGISDAVEVAAGLDPRAWDVNLDVDQDSVPSGEEIEWHLQPTLQQTEEQTRERYRYDRLEKERLVDGRVCYDFTVSHVRLTATRQNEDLGLLGAGYNDIRLYLVETMKSSVRGEPLIRTACLRARYVPPTLKAPASGEIAGLTDCATSDDPDCQSDFVFIKTDDPLSAAAFDPSRDCREIP